MKNAPETVLHTETPDNTPDTGPKCRSSILGDVLSVVALIAAVGFTGFFYRNYPAFFWLPLLILGVPGLYGVWRIFAGQRGRTQVPESRRILAGELGFDLLCTCRGVAATSFFVPDQAGRGEPMRLLLFLENYTTRQRIIRARFGHLPSLGRPTATYVHLHLAAGQAAVYVLPVNSSADITQGFHRLSVTLCAQLPTGYGQRLRGARRHPDMYKVRFATPFEIVSGRPEPVTATPLPEPRYISLASVSEKELNLSALQDLLSSETPE